MMRVFVVWALFATFLSAKTQIRISGVDQKYAALTLEKLEGRLAYVHARPAGPSRADDAAFLLKRHLILEGYRDVDVEWALPGDGSIHLKVNHGARYTLGKFIIRNAVVADPEKHTDYFLQPFVSRNNTVQEVYPYLREDYLAGIENLRNYLRSQGYWDAEVQALDPVFDATARKVNVTLEEVPGTQFFLRRPELRVSGSSIPANLLDDLELLQGRVASTENINKMRKVVRRAFTSQGYPFLTLKMKQQNEGGRTLLSFDVTTGDRFKVGDVKVEGNERSKERRIRRRFKDLQGEEFDREESDHRIRKLLGTGAFESIQLEEHPQPDGSLDFLLRVDEARHYGVKAYAGVGSLEGFIIGAGYFDRNLWGQLYQLELGLEYSGLGLLGEVSLTDPFFLERDLKWQNRLFLLSRDYDGYQKLESGIESSLDWEVNDYYDVRLSLGVSYVDLSTQDGLPQSALGSSNYVMNRLSLTQTYDRRNDIALPTKGYIAELETHFGLALGSDAVTYFANELRYTWYHELSQKSRIALGGRLGAIKPLGDDSALPIDLRYFIGGSNSVRSFSERELGPSLNGVPLGGQSYFIANAEYIHSIVGPLKGLVFLDAGGLSTDLGFGFNDAKYAAGLGFQLDLPIGPVRFEYGRSLNRENDDPSGAFHFAIGTAF